MKKLLILLAVLAAIPTWGLPVHGNLDVSGYLKLSGWFQMQGIYFDTTGWADGYTLTINATGDTARFTAAGTGDITSVVAGAGLKGGATSGPATLDIINLFGLTIGADSISVDTALVATLYDIAGMIDSTRVLVLLGGKADSSLAFYWPDSTALLAYIKALALARGDTDWTQGQIKDSIDAHPEVGDISGVTAGDGLGGGGTTGAVTLTANVLTGGGVAITTDSLEIDDEVAQDLAGAMVTGNTETRIAVTYQDADGTIDFVVDDFLDPADSADVAKRAWVSSITDPMIDSARVKVLDGAKADSGITITAGNGLTGGGSLAANRMINLVGGYAQIVGADSTKPDTTLLATKYDVAEATLEGVLDLQDLQGAVTDAQVPDNITITETGDISSVVAGDGLSGGATSGAATVTANVLSGGGMKITTDSLAFDSAAALAYVKALILARADSALAMYWPDSTELLTYVKALILARADSSLSLYWADSTALLAYIKSLDALKSPIASPTFTGTVTMPTPFTLGAVSVLPTGTELNYVDGVTSAIQTQLGGKPDSALVGHLAQAETIAGNWVNTANPWDVNEGGTGANTLTDGGILLGSGTGAITALGVATNGQIPIGDGTTDPVLATITGSAQDVVVTNGAGTITLSTRKPFQFTVVNPKNVGDTVWVWKNLTGATITIDSIQANSNNDTCAFSLVESAYNGGTTSLVDAVDANTAGTNCFIKTETTITAGSIEANNRIGYVKSADSTESIEVIGFNH